MYPGTYAAATPDKVAAVMTGTGETLTYSDLELRSVQLAHVLHEAGLRPGDVIIAVGGRGISDTEALAVVLAGLHPGQRVPVTAITSEGGKVTVQVILGQLPGS